MQLLEFLPEFAEGLRGGAAPVIITGAGGWLGQAALEMCDAALGDDFAARVTAFGARPRTITLRSGRNVALHPLEALAGLEKSGALVLHLAFLTREHSAAMDLATYIDANRRISALMQDFLRRCGARGIFMPSSGAAYAGTTLAQNPYGALKREDEAVFGQLAAQSGFPAALIRAFNLGGPFINKRDSYALACIVSDIEKGGPIKLRAAHPVWRGYAHVSDVLNIGLGVLLNRLDPGVFDSSGEAVEIGALALRAARLLKGGDIGIERPSWQDGPADRYLGDPVAFNRLAAAFGIKLRGLDQQIMDTAAYMRALPS